uniref:Uncharacterized protein n=1 Tax=Siphoviridae sp. cttqT1 TaxID=2827961 RepID=A0A8S5TP25_9CAUD|nr:MAG TPA: hypothetical protein [Caudoviricetes sp.]DAF64883.1 MAG TPA: hypothetical protein [Siphoviridae sp. cttqT1]
MIISFEMYHMPLFLHHIKHKKQASLEVKSS